MLCTRIFEMKRTPTPKFSPHLQFVATRTHGGLRLFRHPRLCQEFLQALRELRQEHPFKLFAYVIMPNHVHLVVHPSDGRIPELMKKLKSLSARRIINCLKKSGDDKLLTALRKATLGRKQDTYQVWQDGFHAVPLWSEWMIRKKIDYVHANPLRQGVVKSAKDYTWSSFSNYHGIGNARIPLDPVPS